MKTKQHPLAARFKCTGADCPSNCCRGWRIPIDDDEYVRYAAEKGLMGFLLRRLLVKKGGLASFRCSRRKYRCPFWGLDRLCALQKHRGADYIPLICAQFPRKISNFGLFCEETLCLSCPEAARLFIEYSRTNVHFEFEETDKEVSCEADSTNDDYDFLDYLLKSRDELISMLYGGCGLGASFLEYAKAAQEKCLAYGAAQGGHGLGSADFGLPSPHDFAGADSNPFTLNTASINTLFFNGFYHRSLKHSSLVLYKLCTQYIRDFYTLTKRNPNAADEKLHALMESVYAHVPDFDSLMVSYYVYYLQKNFLDIFEDYSFYKHVLCGMVNTQMIKLFAALYCKSYPNVKFLNAHDLGVVIAVYERRAPQLEDALKILVQRILSL